ncbi:MAG TPA: hypothetical protein VHO01_00260 [Jatrophihabitans sp.]|nr:hypothetical protein [Jatrophihabitans sp.]
MQITQNRRAWIAASVAVALLIALASWFMLISPTLSDTSSLKSRRADVQLQNDMLRSKIAKLKGQNDNLPSLQQELQAAVAGLPADAGLSDLTRQASAESKLAGVSLTGMTFGAATPVAPAGTSARPNVGKTAVGGMFSISVTVTTAGPAAKQYEFLRLLQHVGPRRVLITSTNLTPASGSQVASIDPSSTMVTVLTAFSAPTTPAAQAQLQKLLGTSNS